MLTQPTGPFRARHCLCLVLLLLPACAVAQPSGGPYGPIDRVYEVPDSVQVSYVAPDDQADAK